MANPAGQAVQNLALLVQFKHDESQGKQVDAPLDEPELTKYPEGQLVTHDP